eukprot:scaffold897_cov402-Prasinococcus_capsulatus_cf.AAC.16
MARTNTISRSLFWRRSRQLGQPTRDLRELRKERARLRGTLVSPLPYFIFLLSFYFLVQRVPDIYWVRDSLRIKAQLNNLWQQHRNEYSVWGPSRYTTGMCPPYVYELDDNLLHSFDPESLGHRSVSLLTLLQLARFFHPGGAGFPKCDGCDFGDLQVVEGNSLSKFFFYSESSHGDPAAFVDVNLHSGVDATWDCRQISIDQDDSSRPYRVCDPSSKEYAPLNVISLFSPAAASNHSLVSRRKSTKYAIRSNGTMPIPEGDNARFRKTEEVISRVDPDGTGPTRDYVQWRGSIFLGISELCYEDTLGSTLHDIIASSSNSDLDIDAEYEDCTGLDCLGLHGALVLTHEDTSNPWKGKLFVLVKWSAFSNDIEIEFLPNHLFRGQASDYVLLVFFLAFLLHFLFTHIRRHLNQYRRMLRNRRARERAREQASDTVFQTRKPAEARDSLTQTLGVRTVKQGFQAYGQLLRQSWMLPPLALIFYVIFLCILLALIATFVHYNFLHGALQLYLKAVPQDDVIGPVDEFCSDVRQNTTSSK